MPSVPAKKKPSGRVMRALRDLVRRTASEDDDQPETVVKQLKRQRVVEPVEQGEGYYIVTGPLLEKAVGETIPLGNRGSVPSRV